MSNVTENLCVAFIIGSPRSGTTVLGDILDRHPQISQWHEPYFVWDQYFRDCPDDQRKATACTPRVRNQIYKAFSRYKKKMRCQLVLDKSPRNSLKIPFIREVFPQARFIHILRDGRDVTLSIHTQWIQKRNIIHDPAMYDHFNYLEAVKVAKKRWLDRQPLLKDKIRAIWFETHGHLLDKSKHLNRLRWNGFIGWGPRFKGWQQVFQDSSLLQFNAHQWLKCVENIQECWHEIPEKKRLEIRYEVFITRPKQIVTEILHFLGMKTYDSFFNSIPKLKEDNFNKWQREFTKLQLNEIHPILTAKLIALGYEHRHRWHEKTITE